MGIAPQKILRRGQAAVLQQLHDAPAALLFAAAQAVYLQRAQHDLLDGLGGQKGVEGVLEHHLHHLVKGLGVLLQDGPGALAVDAHVARGGRFQIHQGATHGGLAAAGLADDAEDLTLAYLKADAAHRLHHLLLFEQAAGAAVFVEFFQPFHFNKGVLPVIH